MEKNSFEYVWRKVSNALAVGAPLPVTEALIRCNVSYEVNGADFVLQGVEDVLRDYMEENLSRVKPVLWPYIKNLGCKRMIYKTCDYGTKGN